jgi:predicted metal-dependent phosphoesterase TrpH
MRVVTHCHTYFSEDGFITPQSLTKQCKKRHIDCVCITDHGLMRALVEFAGRVPVRIIPGEEIPTGQGEIIGLFLKEEIPGDLGLEQTVNRIKAQGGIVYLPHPFDEFRKSAVKLKDAEKLKNQIDVVEVFNSRTRNAQYDALALRFARENNIVMAVGSDAHHPFELGNAYMEMRDFDGPEDFLKNLKSATYKAKKCPFALRLYIKALKIATGRD